MEDRTQSWFGRRTSRWQDWPPRRLLELKQRRGRRISVVIPARNEERTVAGVARAISRSLIDQIPLVDELLVIDSDSTDVTELVARPLISLWWPELAGVVQPLAGEWAARRSLMESLSIPVGYGVELATLLDTVCGHGLDAVAQVDLGTRAHRHQANHDLALMAAELLLVAERRRPEGQRPETAVLQQFERAAGQVRRVSRPVPAHERPPAASAPERPGARRPVAERAGAGRRGAAR